MTNPYDAIIDDDLNPAQGSEPPNPYASIIDNDIKSMNTARAQSSMKASQVNPSQELEVRETAKRLNVEPDILRENMDEAKRQLKTRDLEDAVSQFSTPSQAFLMENDNLGVVQEDLPRLKALEEALLNREQFDAERQARERGFLSNSLRGMGERADTLVGNTLEFLNNAVFSSIRETTDSTSIGVFSMPIEEYERQGMSPAFQIGGYGFDLSTAATEEGAAEAGTVAAPFDRDLGYQPRYTPEQIKEDPSVQNIAGFIGEQGMVSIPDMLAAVFTTPAYVASRTQEIGEDRVASDNREGQPELGDLAAAAPAAVATALIERFATNRLFNPPTRTVTGTIAAGVAREAGTEFVQEQVEYAGGVIGTETPFDIGESLERGAFGALAGGGIGGAVSSAQQVYTRAVQYNRSRRDKDYVSKVGEAANASETNRDVLRDMIARSKGQGPVQEMYVDANQFRELFQSAGLDPDAIAERMPSVTEQYYESAAIGGDLAISLEDYATVIADTAVNSQFVDLVRTEQNGMSSAEAQQWYEEQAEPMIRAATEYDPAAENPGGDQVFQDVVGQLIGTGMDQSTAERNASLYKAFFSVMGQYEGRDPFEIYQDYGLAINRPQAEILQRRRPVDEFDNMLDRLRAGDIPSQMEIEGQSLTQFLRERGGLMDDGGEVSAMDIDEGLQAFQRRMIQEGGMSLDAAAEVAAEEGYITEADPNQLLEKLRDETRGNPAFSPARSNDQLRTLAADLLEMDEALREAGLDPATMSNDEIRDAINGNRTVPDPDTVEFDQAPPTDSEAFRNWFGDSQVVDENGDPLVVYHGTGNTDSIYDGGFNPDITGQGMDQLGSGFYFTNDPDEARGYETAVTQNLANRGDQKLGGDSSPGTVQVYLSIKNPLNIGGSNLADAGIELEPDQVVEILKYSESSRHEEDSPFGNFFEEYWDGGTQDWMYESVAETYVGNSLISLENDFFDGESKNFRRALSEVFGYDGVVQEFEGGKKHFVAWFPEQIKSTSNRGTFDPADPNILNQDREPVISGDSPGGVTLYHGTASDSIPEIAQGGMLRGPVYLTPRREVAEDYSGGESVIQVRVPESEIKIDLDLPGGRLLTVDEANRNLDREGWTLEDYIDDGSSVGVDSAVSVTRAQLEDAYDGDLSEVSFNQASSQAPRGRILIDRANQNFNIELLEGANLSTFLHETGHYFLEVMGSIATDPAASERTKQMYADALSWMQVDGPEQIGTEQHELFARTFEAYLRDGKAPSAELQPFFQRFKAWLSQIYRTLLQLNANLTDEVRSVFDRMLATDEQIQQAQEEAGYLVSLMDIEGLAWTEDEQRRLAELRESARSQAEADLMSDQMRDLDKAQQKWWRDELNSVRQEMWDSLNSVPQYQARQMLTAGKRANGDALPEGVEPLKLNKKALVDEFGEDFLKRLPSPRNPQNKAPQYVYSREGGEDPGVVARMYGYPSVRAMVNDLINSRPVREYVEALSQAEMRDRYPDINLSGQAAETAKQSVYNDKQAQLMLLELKKLEGMVGGRQTIPKVMRQKAAEMVAGMKVRDVRPDLYARKTSRYGREAFDAASRGDTNAAILAKQRELMHHYLYKESLKAREQSESVYRYAKRLQKKAAQERIGKAGGEYLERINGILEQYEFRRVTNKELDRRQSLAQWLEGRQADGDHVDVPPEVVERSQRVNWREVPVEELLAARDALRNLEHVARNKNRLLADRDKRELEEVLRPVVDQILAKGDKAGKGFFADDSLTQKVKDGLRDYASAGLNMDTILRGLDGYEDLGLAYQAIKAPIDRAAREELPKRQQEYGDKLAAVYNKRFTRAEQRAMGKRDFMQISDGRWLSREEALSVALNMGNEGNLEAVYSGVASAKDQLARDDVRLIKDSLGQADWDFVQDVWDMLDFELWPLVRDAQKARTGVAPQKVEATPVVTKFGTYRGGYYPIKFDSGLSFRATEQQMDEMAQQVKFGSFAKAQTRRGHTIERTNSGGNPLNYSLSVLHSHIETALVDVTMGDAINDVSRIITHRDFVNAMQRTGNTWALKAMENWLKDTASQEVISSHFLSKAVRHIRVGFTMSKLSWNVGTILLQPFGLAQSIPDIGYRNMMHGIAAVNPTRWMGDNSVFRQIEEKSPFMRTRGASFNKDIQATQQAMKGSGWLEAAMERVPGASRWSQGFAEKAKASLMGGIIATQRVVDGMVWMGAYQKGKQQFTTDSEAIQYADSMVARTQASGIFSDRTAFERGTIDNQTRQSEFVRLWTTLGSYMFAKGNVAYEKTAQVHWRNPDEVFKWMHDMFMLFTFEAILIGLLRNMIPDDEEEIPGYLAEETLYTVMSTMPIVREAASALGGFQGGGVLGSFFNDVAKVKTQAEQGEVDAPLLKALNNVGGVLFKYPSSQTNRVFENLWKDMNGEDVEVMDYLLYRESDD